MEKNTIIELKIEDYTTEGFGVGHAEGMAVFVKDAVIGDELKVKIVKNKKTYAYGRIEEILRPGADRVAAPCPSARACGGCQLQMTAYPAQLRWKEDKVRNCLQRIGGFKVPPTGEPAEASKNAADTQTCPASEGAADTQACLAEAGGYDLDAFLPVIGMEEPWHYRNKAQLPVRADKEGRPVAGFFAGRTHSIIEQKDCRIGQKDNQEVVDLVLGWMQQQKIAAYNETTGSGLIRHICMRSGYATGERMVILVLNRRESVLGKHLGRKLEALADQLMKLEGMTSVILNYNAEKTNVIYGRSFETLRGRDVIEDTIGEVRYQISARSFYQVNPIQTQKLYAAALEYAGLTGKEKVWDLYCGIGTISLFLAQKAKEVYGVEIVPEAIEDARKNAALNGITNAQFYVGKAEEVLPKLRREQGIEADVIVIDPPRKGCEEIVLQTMLDMAPERIVYVSCDPATMARDLKILCGGDYHLSRVQPVDMFPHTTSVENVCLLTKKHGMEIKG
ncbi:MAG: 23S rRNA (uracil(1939)-C(5))-methyltransferase RlmD [Lachnospiraceae bacterium]|nr:23S rRNA (uracil(1939)-C(5))-methyltransferase RlmD [Lachnospiraceae bacterium]